MEQKKKEEVDKVIFATQRGYGDFKGGYLAWGNTNVIKLIKG